MLQSFFKLAVLTLSHADVTLLISFVICLRTTYVAFCLFGFYQEEYHPQVHSFDKLHCFVKSSTLLEGIDSRA